MGDFSSYYKYEKFEVIGDELIPLGIYSIDADGTMPYVVKEECDTACGCIEPQYRWIQTEDTICIEVLTQTVSGSPYCVGYDRYEDVYSQVSYDNGVTWETTATTSTMIEENSSACGYVPPTPTTEYRWVDDGGTTCVGVDKYNRKVKQVSYDGGSTWMNVSPLTVSATTLVEANSPDCGYVAPQYRTISGDPYCNGVDKYEDVYSQVSYDGGSSWETTATTSTLIQAKSADCGYAERTISGDPYCSGVDKYVDVSAQTSSDSGSTWTTTATTPTLVQAKSTDCGFSARTISTATTCVGVDKHYLDEYQESYDFGQTWTTISSSTGTLIEAKSADCGYAERTISGTPYCDGADLVVVTSAQTSSDSGSTWTTVSTAITMVESGSSQCHQTVHVTGVTLNKNSMSLNSGSSETLVATVSPSNADDKSVTWSSNNTSVATVNSSGLVSGVTSGSATITVTTTDGGYTAQCSVSVTAEAHDYRQDYLTLVALEDGTFSFTSVDSGVLIFSYSVDGGSTWSEASSAVTTPTITRGNRVLWKYNKPNSKILRATNGIGTFSSTGYFNAEGNVMSMLRGSPLPSPYNNISGCFRNLFKDSKIVDASNVVLDAELADYCYNVMFAGCTSLTAAPSLPTTTLAYQCYMAMFYNCTSLTTAPSLPATTLASQCYLSMFVGCSSLTTAPSLPATTLADSCYLTMFDGCTSLRVAPNLLATTLYDKCYREMFRGCNNLATAPSLPATTLASQCYYSMFKDCTSLATAPSLPATTLANYCYYGMFQGCASLATAPSLPATTLADACYKYMFNGCTSLATAPTLSATTLADGCYDSMFNGCTNLNNITCLATDISASYCTYNWVKNVAASGTFTKAASMNDWTTGNSGIPSGWTVQDYSN